MRDTGSIRDAGRAYQQYAGVEGDADGTRRAQVSDDASATRLGGASGRHPEATAAKREAQTAAFLDSYRKNYKGPSEEEKAEMRAAFGTGTTVVNVITGQRTKL